MKKEYITPKTVTVVVKTCNLLQASETYSVKSMEDGGTSTVGDEYEN